MNDIKIICLYGPESTGKSTLAKNLAAIYKTELVPEVSKEIITTNNFTIEDIVRIGLAQTQRIKEKLTTANKILFCDTDLITTQIYSQFYLGVVPPILYELEREIQYDTYFLLDIDVPWIADGLRDLGNKRDVMMATFKSALDDRGLKYQLVKGTYSEREGKIVRAIDALLNS